jgi:oligopeptide/dipeptide ABC transporter ATP-binding protein
MTSEPALSFRGVTKRYGRRVAVRAVDLDLQEGTTLGIVGESGSGKTTCVRLAIGLERPSAGTILLDGRAYLDARKSLRAARRRIGYVFQDPYESLDPRMTIGDVVAEPLRIHGIGGHVARERVSGALASVGLPDAKLDNYPAQYSGGGRQRIAIARALVMEPDVLLCDEPTASLDVSVQAQIINLLLELRASRQLSMVFVSHDLDLIRRVSNDIVVMYAGRAVELGPVQAVSEHPRHPYTVSLLDSIPGDDPRRRKLVGRDGVAVGDDAVGGPDGESGACVYLARCHRVQAECSGGEPSIRRGADGVAFACFNPEELGGSGG